jgi:hypothetical protein
MRVAFIGFSTSPERGSPFWRDDHSHIVTAMGRRWPYLRLDCMGSIDIRRNDKDTFRRNRSKIPSL